MGERQLSCVPVVDFRGATSLDPQVWEGVNPPGNHNPFETILYEVSLKLPVVEKVEIALV